MCTTALCGRDRSGGAAVPERSAGMEAKAGTTDSPIFGSLRKQTDKKPPGNLKSGQTQNGAKKMTIRRANEKDIPKIIGLLGQVLQIHAEIRPDIFIPGTTKYTDEELLEMLRDESKPIYVAADENDSCVGYAFCQLREQSFSNNMVQFKSLFIDDLCVDKNTRGRHIGEKLFEHVKSEAKRLGCYEVTLNVWAGNTSAEKFYEKMGLKTKERQLEYIL